MIGADGAALRQKSGGAETRGEDRGRYQMQRHRSVRGVRSDARQRPAGQHQHVRIGADRPFGEHDEHQCGRGADAPVAASLRQATNRLPATSRREHDHRGVGVKTVQHDQRGAKQICGERAGRDRLDLAFVCGRAEHEAAHHKQRGEDEPGDHMERMRADHRGSALQAGERPQQRERDRGDREPAPQPDARQTEGRRGDDGEIDVERPEVRLVGRDQDRRDEGAGDAETGERRPVQQRGGERAERHQSEQDEGGGRRQKAVQRIGRIDRRKRHRRSGGGQDRRDIGDRQRFDGGDAFLAPRPFAGQRAMPARTAPPSIVRTPGPSRPASIE